MGFFLITKTNYKKTTKKTPSISLKSVMELSEHDTNMRTNLGESTGTGGKRTMNYS